jgi:hypothetical protein
VLLAVDLASNLEVIIAERFLAVNAGETARVELLALLGLEVRSFDTTVAVGTQRVVEFVIMVFTVWVVVNDIEVSGRKGWLAGLTDEAVLVVTTGETTIGSLDGLALYGLTAASADMLGWSSRAPCRCRSGREAVFSRWRRHRSRRGRHGTLRALGEEARNNRWLRVVALMRSTRSVYREAIHLLGRTVKPLSNRDGLLRSDKAGFESVIWAQAVVLLGLELQAGNNKRGIR